MPTSPRHALTALFVALVVLLTGCAVASGDPEEAAPSSEPSVAPVALEPGTCWTDEQVPAAMGEEEFLAWAEQYAGQDPALIEALADDAAFSDQVDCAEPHALELYEVVSLPPRLDRRVEEYADLLEQDSPLHGRVRDAVNQACLAGSVYGRAERRAGDLGVQLGPALSEAGGLRLAWDPFPPERWEEGERRFVCTFEQDEPSPLRFAQLTTSKVPVAARVCLDVPGRSVRCGRPHQAEEIGEMVLNTAVARGRIDADRALRRGPDGRFVAFSDAEYDRLDRVCTTLYEQVSRGREDVEAQVFPGAVDQWPTEEGAYVASCFALKPFDPIPRFRGTVFDRPRP